MPFPGPSLIFFPALSARSFVVPALHSLSLPSHLQTVGWGFFPGLAGRAPDGHRLRHRIKDSFNRPAGVGAGSAPRREQTRFCVGVCLGGLPTPGREARAATPEEAGPPSRAPPGADSRPPPPPSLFRYTALSRAENARPGCPGALHGLPPTPLRVLLFPLAFSFFLDNSILAGRLAKLRLKSEKREKKDTFGAPASFLQSLRRILTMSESGEISEFGYIMELLARGKVSAGARGAAAWVPPPVPAPGNIWPVAVGVPGPGSPRGGRDWSPRSVFSARTPQSLLKARQTSDLPPSPPPLIARHLCNEPKRTWPAG